MCTQSYNNVIHQNGLCEFASEFDALKRLCSSQQYCPSKCMDGVLYAKFKVFSSELHNASLICSTKVKNIPKSLKL
jgi:hypothetical protein